MKEVAVILNGEVGYARVLHLQRAWAAAVAEGRLGELIWIGSHPPVITLGRRAEEGELRLSLKELKQKGVEVHWIERGGLATLHGPGQLVAYPVWSFEGPNLGVRDFVRLLEEAMIQTLDRLGVRAGRSPLNPGAWVGQHKIGFLGLAIRRRVSFHGLALNLNLDPALFDLIIPCGLEETPVTSAHLILGRPVDMDEAGSIMAQSLSGLLERRPVFLTLAEAEARLGDGEAQTSLAQG